MYLFSCQVWFRLILWTSRGILFRLLQCLRMTRVCLFVCLFACLTVLSATFSNISAISWRSVLLVEETGGPGQTTNLLQVTDKLYYIMLYTLAWSRFQLKTSVVIGTDYIGSCKFNYHAITAMTVYTTMMTNLELD